MGANVEFIPFDWFGISGTDTMTEHILVKQRKNDNRKTQKNHMKIKVHYILHVYNELSYIFGCEKEHCMSQPLREECVEGVDDSETMHKDATHGAFLET